MRVALTIDHDARTYHIGDMGFKGVADFTSNTVICTNFDNCNRNIKTVGLVTIDDRVFIKITLNSEFPMYEGYESLRSEVY